MIPLDKISKKKEYFQVEDWAEEDSKKILTEHKYMEAVIFLSCHLNIAKAKEIFARLLSQSQPKMIRLSLLFLILNKIN